MHSLKTFIKFIYAFALKFPIFITEKESKTHTIVIMSKEYETLDVMLPGNRYPPSVQPPPSHMWM